MHNHDHTHEHVAPHAGQRALGSALAFTFAYSLIEAVAGWWSGSLALLSDAGHMLSDSAALSLALFAAWIAARPPSVKHSYGLGRAETVAALINSLAMIAIVVGIVVSAIARFQQPRGIDGGVVTGVAIIGLFVNIAVFLVLSRGVQSLNTRGALLHVMGDLLGSIAAILSGAVIYFTGWTPIDPILSLFICAIILASSLALLRESVHVIMEGVPANIDLREVGLAMARIDGVASIHDLHIWTLAGGRAALSAHIVVGNMSAWIDILDHQRQMLAERFDITHVTLQPEVPATTLTPAIVEPLHRRNV